MYRTVFILLSLFFLASCGGFQEAGQVLRNEKVKTTDEFLVKKRDPLVLPPDYNVIPEPNTKSEIEKSEKEKIKNILKLPKEENKVLNSSSVEESILKKIGK